MGDCANELGEEDEDEEDVSEYVNPLKVWLNIADAEMLCVVYGTVTVI